MKQETVKCKFCNVEISEGPCRLAAYNTIIDGKTITFCCQTCANEYKQKKAKLK